MSRSRGANSRRSATFPLPILPPHPPRGFVANDAREKRDTCFVPIARLLSIFRAAAPISAPPLNRFAEGRRKAVCLLQSRRAVGAPESAGTFACAEREKCMRPPCAFIGATPTLSLRPSAPPIAYSFISSLSSCSLRPRLPFTCQPSQSCHFSLLRLLSSLSLGAQTAHFSFLLQLHHFNLYLLAVVSFPTWYRVLLPATSSLLTQRFPSQYSSGTRRLLGHLRAWEGARLRAIPLSHPFPSS